MLRTGKVVAAGKGELQVCFERPEACAHCRACGEAHESLVTIPGSAPVGSRIDVDMPEKQVLKASLLAYVIPLAMLLAGLAAGSAILHSEVWAAVCGVVCMGLSWFVLRLLDRRVKQNAAWRPTIVAVHEEKEPAASFDPSGGNERR